MSQTEKKVTQESAKSTAATNKSSKVFTVEERAAMKERAKELKAEARATKNKAEGERDVLAKIAELPEPERAMAERLHEIITASAPVLAPKTLVRDARVYQGRQDRLLLPERAEVQHEVRDARLQRHGEPRRRRHVADCLRGQGVDRRRRGKDQRACEESGELRG